LTNNRQRKKDQQYGNELFRQDIILYK